MRHIEEIMKNLGFDKNSSEATQAAFVKHLVKKAYGVDLEIPEKYKNRKVENETQLNLFEKPPKKAG